MTILSDEMLEAMATAADRLGVIRGTPKERMVAALQALAAQGYAVVPLEPTNDQMLAGWDYMKRVPSTIVLKALYQAMIRAAQEREG